MKLYILVLISVLTLAVLGISPVLATDAVISANNMSGYAQAGYTVNGTTQGGNWVEWKAFDGVNTTTAWYAGTGSSNWWVRQYIPTNDAATSYEIYPYYPNSGFDATRPTAWNFDGSDDGSSYTTLDNQAVSASIWVQGQSHKYTFSNTHQYRYYRLFITQISGSGSPLISEVYIYKTGTTAPVASYSSKNVTPVTNSTSQGWGGYNPFTMIFNDTSSNSPTSYSYQFKDVTGNNTWVEFSTTKNASISFGVGNYSLRLNATNTAGTGTSTQVTFVNVTSAPIPQSNFSMFNAAGTAPHTTYLYDTSTNLTPGLATYAWDLGDGNTSTAQNLYFTWNATGTYNVTHTVSNGLSSSTSFTNVTVGTPTPPVVAPVASFYGGPQTGNVPLTVFFTDVSSNTPTSWNWSFGDGKYSELQNPQHQYNSSGFRTVNLTATNSAGSNITVRAKFVKVS